MTVPRALVHRSEFASAVVEVERMFYPNVQRIRYTLEDDWAGEPAVFFKIVLSDAASSRDQLRNITEQVSRALVDQIEPPEKWDVLPYFNYRSQSEQAILQEEAWA